MRIEELNIYPLKSARAQKTNQMKITHEGPVGDRQWMLVDESGQFLSQRTLPKIATVEVFFEESALTLGFQKTFFKISTNSSFKRPVKVQIWNDTVEAALEPDLYSQALSQYLGVNCRLVRYAPYSQRRVRSHSQDWKPEVRFADGRPLHLINTKSIEDLCSRIGQEIPRNRFRANIFFAGQSAYEEDQWKRIRIGEVVLSQPKPCARCVYVNIDQATGQIAGPEPLKTLQSYRPKVDDEATFGALWIPENTGIIRENDVLEVLE